MMYDTVDILMLVIIAFVMGLVAAGGLYAIFISPIKHSRERRAYMHGYFDAKEESNYADNSL